MDGILCRQSMKFPNSKLQVVVPKGLRAVIIDQLHAKSGHLGGYKTFGKVREQFFWPGYELRESGKNRQRIIHWAT